MKLHPNTIELAAVQYAIRVCTPMLWDQFTQQTRSDIISSMVNDKQFIYEITSIVDMEMLLRKTEPPIQQHEKKI